MSGERVIGYAACWQDRVGGGYVCRMPKGHAGQCIPGPLRCGGAAVSMRIATVHRCGDCWAEVTPGVAHDCNPLPLSTARVAAVEWHYLNEPDETDLLYATYVVHGGKRLLEPCPSCGANAGPPVTKVRADNGMVQTTVECGQHGRCGMSVFWNARTKAEAHAGAVRLWNDRRPARERVGS